MGSPLKSSQWGRALADRRSHFNRIANEVKKSFDLIRGPGQNNPCSPFLRYDRIAMGV